MWKRGYYARDCRFKKRPAEGNMAASNEREKYNGKKKSEIL